MVIICYMYIWDSIQLGFLENMLNPNLLFNQQILIMGRGPCQPLARQTFSTLSNLTSFTCYDITEILLKVALNTITLTPIIHNIQISGVQS